MTDETTETNQAEVDLKAKEKEEARLAKQAEKAEKKAVKEKEKEARAAAREAKKVERQKAIEEKKAQRLANQMPMQNGVRRPKPETLCGRVWAHADAESARLQQPVPIKELLEVCIKDGLNPGNVKCEYSAWRKFNNVTGRITSPKAESKEEAAA